MENQAIYVHATNATLEETMNLIDPFARKNEDVYALLNYEDEFEFCRR